MILRIAQGRGTPRECRFSDGPVTLGRDPASDVAIDDRGVSRAHAEIRRDRGHWVLRDCGSTNGTFVNGVRITETGLKTGDSITIGAVTLEVSLEDIGRRPGPAAAVLIGILGVGGLIAAHVVGTDRAGDDRGSIRSALTEGGESPAAAAPGGPTGPGDEGTVDLLRVGEARLKDWRIARGNAYRAQKAFEQVLQAPEGDPGTAARARDGLEKARRIVEEEFRRLRFSAERAVREGDLRGAEEDLKAILEAIPDAADPRARYAQERTKNLRQGIH